MGKALSFVFFSNCFENFDALGGPLINLCSCPQRGGVISPLAIRLQNSR